MADYSSTATGKQTSDEMGMKEADAKANLARVWQGRISRAEELQKPWVEAGRSYKKFIEGDQWADQTELLSHADYCVSTVNRTGNLVDGMISAIAFTVPTVVAKPIRRGFDAMRKASVNTQYLNYCLRESKFDEHMELVARDAIVYGAGFFEQGTDPERNSIPMARWLSAEDVLVDPDANTLSSSMSWVGYKFSMNVHTARRKFKVPDLMSDDEYARSKQKRDGAASDHGLAAEDQRVTLYKVYARADAVGWADASENAENSTDDEDTYDGEPEMAKALRKLGNRCYVISKTHEAPLLDEPWKFVLDHDEFPISIVRSQRTPGDLLPISLLKRVMPLQRQLNWCLTYLITQARTTAQNIFVVNKEQADDSNILEAIQSKKINKVVFAGQMGADVKKLELGNLNQAVLTLFGLLIQQYDSISGYQELFGSMRGARSALEAGIRADRADTLVGLIRSSFERGLNEVVRHMMQIAFSTGTTDHVVEILGRTELDLVEDPTDIKAVVSPYWDEKMTPEQIRSEVDILLEVGSTRRVNRDQEAQDAMAIMDRLVSIIGAVRDMGFQIQPQELAGKLNYVFGEMMRSMGREDVAQITFDPAMFKPEPNLMRHPEQPPEAPQAAPTGPQLQNPELAELIEDIKSLPPDEQQVAMQEAMALGQDALAGVA